MKTILSIIAGVVGIVVLLLKRGENHVRVLDKEIDDIDKEIGEWQTYRDKALRSNNSDMLTICHDKLVRLHRRKDTLLQRRREALHRNSR